MAQCFCLELPALAAFAVGRGGLRLRSATGTFPVLSFLITGLICLGFNGGLSGQEPPQPAPSAEPASSAATQQTALEPVASEAEPGEAISLPNEQGQVWRSYDIRAYTAAAGGTEKPETAVLDWILRETGYELWHSSTASVLTADSRRVLAYHTPEVQKTVRDVVDRFVSGAGRNVNYALQLSSVGHPNWRSKALPLMTPVPLKTPGVQAWVATPANAAQILGELRRRNDYREQSAPQLVSIHGLPTVLSQARPIDFVQDILPAPGIPTGYQTRGARLEEGYRLELITLPKQGGSLLETVVKFEVKEVEKLIPVMLDLPAALGPRSRVRIEVPQSTEFRWHEQVQWEAGQVLVVSLGLVPSGVINTAGRPLGIPLPGTSPRADLLLFLDGRPVAAAGNLPGSGPQPGLAGQQAAPASFPARQAASASGPGKF